MGELLCNGKRHLEKAGRRSDALALYQKRKAAARRKLKLPELVPGRVVTFGQLSTMAVEHAETHLKSLGHYKTKDSILREPFGKRQAAAITPQEINDWLTKHCKTPATANRYRAFMSLFYRLGMENGKVESNPARLVRLRAENNARLRFLSPNECKKVLGIVQRDNPMQVPAFIVSVYTGMRWGEQFSLEWGQVDIYQALHLSDMPVQPRQDGGFSSMQGRGRVLLWVSGAWVLPVLGIAFWISAASPLARTAFAVLAVLVAPFPALLFMTRQRRQLIAHAAEAEEEAAQLKLQLDTVRFRTNRLREELQAADRQARLSHQLTLLGQFTAGFMHEFNNPLAIVAGRIEVLLEERKEDAALCADLEQMLKETQYMSKIAGTLLQALRRERAGEIYEASAPQKALEEAMNALRPTAKIQGVTLIEEIAESPRVDVPEHVIAEVVRGLLSNALLALRGQHDGTIWVRLEQYRTAGVRVVARIEDNGPGVPESIREHLFEPFISSGTGRERLGLGLFLAASLLDMYDGRIRYEMRYGGGASFVVELPPARFTRGQPYHWFAGGTTE